MREKCPNTEFFLVHIQSKYGKIQTRKNSVYGHFSISESNKEHSITKAETNPFSLDKFSDKLSELITI